jgi:antitoxin HicB
VLVTCQALPEVNTFGDDEADALRHATDAIEEALAARLAYDEDIPAPVTGHGHVVELLLMTVLKVWLYRELRAAGITRAELQRRLGWKNRESVDRLFRLDHASRPEQIEAAFRALRRTIDIKIKEVA